MSDLKVRPPVTTRISNARKNERPPPMRRGLRREAARLGKVGPTRVTAKRSNEGAVLKGWGYRGEERALRCGRDDRRGQGKPRRYKIKTLDLQGLKIGDAGFHHVQVHFDEVISYAGGFRGGEDFLPIESVLPHRHDFFGLRRPALEVHGKEAAGIFCEIFGGVVALADGGNLELELD